MWPHCVGALRVSTPNTPRCWGSSAGTWQISPSPVHAQIPKCRFHLAIGIFVWWKGVLMQCPNTAQAVDWV